MIRIFPFLSFFFLCMFLAVVSTAKAQGHFRLDFLGEQYESARYCKILPLKKLKHDDVVRMLAELKNAFPEAFVYEKIGESVKGRDIFLVTMGRGHEKILLWSQMHGDEPTATAALFDIFHYLLKNRTDPFVRDILENTTILAVPMLNPDGAEYFLRRNAQDIDINRDARDRQTPEGRILYNLQRTYKPRFGFNLHDQDSRRTVGDSNKLAAIALMAPPFDSTDNDNQVRLDAKRIVSVIYQALGPYIYGHISKYDAGYMPRAFGDSMQNWGVSTILVESGGWYAERDSFLQKMNFIALLTAFKAIADGSCKKANPALYEALEENDKNIYDLMFRDVTIYDGTGIEPFMADVAVNFDESGTGTIEDIGDMNAFAAQDTIEGEDLILTPGLVGVIDASEKLDESLIEQIIEKRSGGFTTVILKVSMDQLPRLEEFRKILKSKQIPLNVGTVLRGDSQPLSDEQKLNICKYTLKNTLGIVSFKEQSNRNIVRDIPKIKIVSEESLMETDLKNPDSERIRKMTFERCKNWNISSRGRIKRGQVADFVLFSVKEGQYEIHSVFLKGYRIYHPGNPSGIPVHGEYWF